MAVLGANGYRKEEEIDDSPGIVTQGVNFALGGLGTLAKVLDTPGSVVRGLLAGEGDRALSGIFNPEDRVSGSELLGHDSDKFTWSGLAAEIVTDPLTFVSVGALSKAGKLAKANGRLQPALKAQTALGRRGSESSVKLAANTAERLAEVGKLQTALGRKANETLGKTFGEQVSSGQRSLLAIDVPFLTKQPIPLSLPGQSKLLKGTGEVLDSVSNTKLVKGLAKTKKAVKGKFVTKYDDPLHDAFRIEAKRLAREERRKRLLDAEAANSLRNKLLAKYPNLDTEVIQAIEVGKDYLSASPTHLEENIDITSRKASELLGARLRAEEQLSKLDPEVWEYAKIYHTNNNTLLEQELANAVPVSRLSDLGYYARILTPQARQLVLTNKNVRNDLVKLIANRKVPGTNAFQNSRALAEEFVRANQMLSKKYKLPKGVNFFDTDIARVQVARSLKGGEQINRSYLAQAVVDTFATTKKAAKKLDSEGKAVPVTQIVKPKGTPLPTTTKLPVYVNDSKTLDGLLGPKEFREEVIDIPESVWNKGTSEYIKEAFNALGVEQDHVPKDVYKLFEDVARIKRYDAIGQPTIEKFVRVSDQIHALYRTAFTQYFPAFHARNWISNVFLNTLGGVTNPKYYYQAARQLRNMDSDELIKLSALGVLDEGKLRETYEILDASPGGVRDGLKNFAKSLGSIADFKTGKIEQAGKQLNLATRKVGNAIENHTRLAHYLAKKAEGLSDTEAADSVLKYLFDYSDLTDFEKAVPRRMMLFYTFFRKNMPLMMEEFFKDPRFLMTYARATGQTNPNIQQPDWLPDSFFFGEDEKGQAIRVNFGLPPEDLARFDPNGDGISRVLQIFISNLVPAIKEPFQYISDTNLFTGRPIEGGAGERFLAALPTARATSSFARINDSVTGQNNAPGIGLESLRLGTGIAVRGIDEQLQSQYNQVDSIRDKLDDLVRQGRGRKISIVGQRLGEQDPQISSLNSLQNKILQDIRKQREPKLLSDKFRSN